jgi:hypothetical protein
MTAEGADQAAISERESGYIHPGDGQRRDLSQLGRRRGSRPGIRDLGVEIYLQDGDDAQTLRI